MTSVGSCDKSRKSISADQISVLTGQVISESIAIVGASVVVCLTGVGHSGDVPKVATENVASAVVQKSNIVFGSVNANKRHWFKAGEALAHAD